MLLWKSHREALSFPVCLFLPDTQHCGQILPENHGGLACSRHRLEPSKLLVVKSSSLIAVKSRNLCLSSSPVWFYQKSRSQTGPPADLASVLRDGACHQTNLPPKLKQVKAVPESTPIWEMFLPPLSLELLGIRYRLRSDRGENLPHGPWILLEPHRVGGAGWERNRKRLLYWWQVCTGDQELFSSCWFDLFASSLTSGVKDPGLPTLSLSPLCVLAVIICPFHKHAWIPLIFFSAY